MSNRRVLETGTEDLLAHVEDRVAVLTMNRPKRRNALSGAMLAGLQSVLAECEIATDVGCVLLTGAGGAFCAGGDVKGMADGDEDPVSRSISTPSIDERIHRQRLSQRGTAGKLYAMPKPTIAALPGAAAGAGLSLALACDLRIAAERAILTTAFAKVGFSGDYGGSYFISKLVGSAKARELYLLSERVESDEALRLGLVNRVVPDDALEKEALSLAIRLAHGPAVAYRYIKENLNRALEGGGLDECLDLEATHHVHAARTRDHQNAVKAFVEKREPVFEGR